MKHIIFIIIILFPLTVFGATSVNFQLNQEGTGFTEFDMTSIDYQSKAIIGDAVSEISTSDNYVIDQRRIWAVTPVEEEEEEEAVDSGGSGNGGGGGGGGGGEGLIVQTGVSFSGRAYPLTRIDLLKDGQILASIISGPDAYFSITVTNINAGSHLFSIIAEDNNGLRSPPFVAPVVLSQGVTTYISGIFLSPTLTVDKKVVKRGDNIAIFGQTVPDGKVTIGVASEHEIFRVTDSDEDGVFLYNFDTTPLENGDHETRAKTTKDNEISEFGRTIAFEVGNQTVLNTNRRCPERGDLNDDCRVNLVDFSITGFWYKKTLSNSFSIREKAALNGDGVINLTDLSIMGFYWTG